MTDDDSSAPASEPFPPLENLDSFSPSKAGSSCGSSSVSPMILDSGVDVGAFMEKSLEETEANPRLSESASTDYEFPSTSSPASPSLEDADPSQSMALISYDPKNSLNCEEKEGDHYSHSPSFGNDYNSPYGPMDPAYDFYNRRRYTSRPLGYGYGYGFSNSRWSPWRWSPPKEPEIEPTGVGAGLENLGNTCFINAVLQCFTHTVPLVLGLRDLNHDKPCSIERFCLLCALHDHIELSLNSSGGSVSPSKIFDNLNYISSCFQRYQQEDAHEFLQCLLDRLESCFSDSKPENDCSSSPDECLVKKVFGGRLVSRLCCCNCGHISCTYEPLNDLSLEIEDVDNLPSALKSFTKVEKIEDLEAKFRCENCKEEVSVEKQLMLDQAPAVATFHLKRFKTEGVYVEKIDKHVEFPLELDLEPYTICDQRSDDELKYRLYAVVKHSGCRPTSGHYVCFIRSSPDTWHRLNDSRVTEVKEEAVLSQEAYILFYARQDTPWFSTAIEVQKPCSGSHISDSSPKSVLDNLESECLNPQVNGSADCDVSESKDVAERTSTQFSCETQCEVKVDEPCVAKETYGLPANESEQEPKLFDSCNDNPMTDEPNCSDAFDKNTSTVSHLGENNCSLGVGVADDINVASMQSRSQCTDKRDSSECVPLAQFKEKRGLHRRAVKRTARDLERNEALRTVKRMHYSRGSKIMAALRNSPNAGKGKKRTGSSPFKRVSPSPNAGKAKKRTGSSPCKRVRPSPNAGKGKKRTGSSPCKRVSPRIRRNLLRTVPF
ncbi:Peptidase C19, ubiquitin carboxyl-terminal hydrolase 2 [Corchorus capsularis]|uniref:Ubiquitin carboxyl-terminal hydrolase n=1 Tax=Corchorus capsularis TaxID=210143 RepID=A0A1R3I410_COCAP|nr:Peptidase C19, ubiquitin carboxyl-terminal hydrolase 2 [Corchorus capsularis]